MYSKQRFIRFFRVPTILLIAATLAGCATSNKGADYDDPLEGMNRGVYRFNDTLDDYVLEPIADGYVEYVPQVVRSSVANFFDNVVYLNVIANDFLQAKGMQGLSDTGRFLVNSTVGVGGLFDPATGWGMPRHNEDLGQTLATWGVGDGAYLELPIWGPSTLRDLAGVVMQFALNPLVYLPIEVTLPSGALGVVDSRASVLPGTRVAEEAAIDPYVFRRSAYYQKRLNLIYDGEPPKQPDEVIEDEAAAPQEKH
jgi:phospholipid-binding lipoprotein MlaA